MNQDEVLKRHFQDLMRRSYDRGITVYSDFLDLHELHILHSLLGNNTTTVSFWGGYEEAERQMAAFLPDAFVLCEEFPMTCLRISPLNAKFASSLSHRDYLGALMHLGIERAMLGDILTFENEAFVFCCRKMSGLIIDELTRIGRTAVTVSESLPDSIPPLRYKSVTGTVASLRLDSCLALAFGLSRNKAIPLIEGGLVYVNGRLITTNAYALKEGDRISLRGTGKCQLSEISGQSKRGKTWIEIKRYQ